METLKIKVQRYLRALSTANKYRNQETKLWTFTLMLFYCSVFPTLLSN